MKIKQHIKEQMRQNIIFLIFLLIFSCLIPFLSYSSAYSAKQENEWGNHYYKQKNYTEAVYWYNKAAEQGYVYAEYNLGYAYFYGQGVHQNYT
jgi:TPR repeat protein